MVDKVLRNPASASFSSSKCHNPCPSPQVHPMFWSHRCPRAFVGHSSPLISVSWVCPLTWGSGITSCLHLGLLPRPPRELVQTISAVNTPHSNHLLPRGGLQASSLQEPHLIKLFPLCYSYCSGNFVRLINENRHAYMTCPLSTK